MPIVNSQTGEVRVDYSLQELQEKVLEMRAWNMIALRPRAQAIAAAHYPSWILRQCFI